MLKKNILILLLCALSGVSSVVGMDVKLPSRVQESEDHSTVCTQDGQAFRVPDRLLRLSETLQNLMQDVDTVKEVLPLNTITGKTWQFIQTQLERIYDLNLEAEKNIKTDLEMLTGSDLIEVIIAVNYLDIPDLLRLVMDVAKDKDLLKEIAFEQLNTLPKELRNPIIMGQAVSMLGPVPGKQLAVCKGHTEGINAACITQDNKIVSGSNDNTIRIWDMEGNQLAQCNGHIKWVRSVSVTHDNKIVSGSGDNTIRIWDMQGNQLAQCDGHTFCITPDNKIVSGSDDKTIRIWDMQGNQLAQCNGHTEEVSSVCVTPDNKIVSGSDDKTIRIWDMQGNQLAQCNGHTGEVFSVCVTPDNKIVSGSYDDTVRIWNMQGKQLALCPIYTGSKYSDYGAFRFRITPDNKIVSVYKKKIRIWDMQGKQLAQCNGHTDWVYALCVTKDNKIVSGSCDGSIRIWDMQGNQLAQCDGDRIDNLAIADDNKIASVSMGWDRLCLWDIELFKNMNTEQAQGIWEFLQKEMLPMLRTGYVKVDSQNCWAHIKAIMEAHDANMVHNDEKVGESALKRQKSGE